MPAHRLLTAALRLAPEPGPTDRDLLAAFVASRDEAAFAEIVRRHGGLVLAACRRVTGHAQDAEDAFQAAFLVLARRAGQLARPDQLGNWMYGVAVRTALDARSARRRIREHALADAPEPAADPPPRPDTDLAGVLDEELARLPEKYRAAVVLCELDGVPRRDAAARLGVPEGTLSSRLAHARKLLAARLARRGVVAPAGVFSTLGATGGAVPAALIDQTARVAARVTGGVVPPGLVSDRVSSLTDGVLKTMFVTKLRLTAGVAALVVAAVGVAVAQSQRAAPAQAPAADPFPTVQQPAAKATAPAQGKAPEPIPAKGIEDDDVPYASVPAPAVVRVEGGKLIVRQRSRAGSAYYTPAGFKVGTSVVGHKYEPADVLVFDMKGNRLAPKAWRAKFEQDQHVLVAWGGVVPNPRELVLFKDDTLVVVLPGMPAGGQQPYARTTYRAVRNADGNYYYEPVTIYGYDAPAVTEVPPQTPYYPPAQSAPAAPATIPPLRRTAPTAPAAPPPAFVPAPGDEPRPDRTT